MPGQSYGGWKQSGMGREGSLEGMLNALARRRSITIDLNAPSRN
jgi:acyl-CoA reductase-like NAD-dependent aldehyde dehydrogenase